MPDGITGSDLASATPVQLANLAASDLMLIGPAESVDFKANRLSALGQTIQLSQSTASRSLNRSLLRIQPGAVVSVRGRLLANGDIEATSISVVHQRYVAGGQSLFLRGLIRAVDPSVGRLVIGHLVVDYTGALHNLDSRSLRVGAEIVAAGIQPSADASFLALSALVRGIGGSDLNGIGGSDLNGIGGSDLNGIGGSDLNGIGGSDLNGIGGSDLNGIGGSDLNGIGGSDLNGIGGSDLNGIGGSDLNGIGGSDLNGIGGSDLNGIGGSDF
jgi:hypothetical protein